MKEEKEARPSSGKFVRRKKFSRLCFDHCAPSRSVLLLHILLCLYITILQFPHPLFPALPLPLLAPEIRITPHRNPAQLKKGTRSFGGTLE